jgi:hypothetical protein
MHRAVKTGILLALVLFSAIGAACDRTGGLPDSPQTGASSSSTPEALGQVTSGQVTLTLDKRQYTASDTIVVTIHNGLSQIIWAADHQTNCTVVTAERLQVGQWAAVDKCQLMTRTRMVSLAAGSSTPQQLSSAQAMVPPESQAPLPSENWTPGTYRVTLTYVESADGTGGPGGMVHSINFPIG